MLIACPQCATRYDVKKRLFADPEQTARCAHCGHVWLPAERPGDNPPRHLSPASRIEIPDPPRLRAENAAADRMARRSRRKAASVIFPAPTILGRFAWLSSQTLTVFILLSLPFIASDATAVDRLRALRDGLFPGLFAPIVPGALKLSNITQSYEQDQGRWTLKIAGDIVNESQQWALVPNLNIKLLNDQNENIHNWNVPVAPGGLGPGGVSPFEARLTAPPQNVTSFTIEFDDGQ